MPKYLKYVNAMFLGASVVVWLIAQHYTAFVIGYFQLGRKLGGGTDFLLHGLPLLMAILTFFLLRRNATSFNFTSDSVSELTKVAWPSQKETRLGTIVVIVTVIMAGAVLGLVDLGFMALIRVILGA